MIRINQLTLPTDSRIQMLRLQAAKLLKLEPVHISTLSVERRSIDARKKDNILFSYTCFVETDLGSEKEKKLVSRLKNRNITLAERAVYRMPSLKAGFNTRAFLKEENRPLVVGFGPAGMFAALILANAGMRPIVIERGAPIEERIRDVKAFFETGVLKPDSNAQFGEGGAGTFSDGKLNTLTRDTEGRSRYILNKFVALGADPSILIDAKPHVGTDRLTEIVKGIRMEIEALGGEVRFHETFHYTGQKNVILAIGHSARDTYRELYEAGLRMEAKDFAMGFRVQHPQKEIDAALYGSISEDTLKVLGHGAYKLTHTCQDGRGVYSFCMCPGGYVVNASSEEGRTAVNGMSYHDRSGKNANAAIIVSVRKSDFNGETDPLAGIRLQELLEERTWKAGKGCIPVQRYEDFKKGIPTEKAGSIAPEIKGQYRYSAIHDIFRFEDGEAYASLNGFNADLIEGMEAFSRTIPCFNDPDTLLSGTETRTSSPVRIPRDTEFRASISGIYPCGEGAGYAGGIMSAAMDGMKAAEALIRHYEEVDL